MTDDGVAHEDIVKLAGLTLNKVDTVVYLIKMFHFYLLPFAFLGVDEISFRICARKSAMLFFSSRPNSAGINVRVVVGSCV